MVRHQKLEMHVIATVSINTYFNSTVKSGLKQMSKTKSIFIQCCNAFCHLFWQNGIEFKYLPFISHNIKIIFLLLV